MRTQIKCLTCGEYLGKRDYRTFLNHFEGYDENGKKKLFCWEGCYNKYKERFEVEVYNGSPIYAIDYLGVKRYMPYWNSNYYFKSIDECKKRIDMDNMNII